MSVSWRFRFKQCGRFRTPRLAQIMQRQPGALSRVHWRSALQIGQREVALSVPAVGRAQQREERCVLAQWQQLAVTECPAGRCEVEGIYSNLRDKWICHLFLLLGWAREDPEQRDDEAQAQIRLEIVVRLAAPP